MTDVISGELLGIVHFEVSGVHKSVYFDYVCTTFTTNT